MNGMHRKIPVLQIEEHHEAFYCWGIGVEREYIKKEGNVLFHVDHHDDLECGGYFHDFTRPFTSLEERRCFTYSVLGIADFIVPGIYEGLFSAMYNMKAVTPRIFGGRERFVRRVGENSLLMGDYVPFLHSEKRKNADPSYRFFSYCEGSLCETPPMERVVLDIDLDYFCWDDSLSTVKPKRLEITEEAYREYRDDPYHPFRILPRILVRAEEEDGHFYLCYQEAPVTEQTADESRIRKRFDRFFEWLRVQPWKPSMITICRSAHSGYLPANHAVLVEELALEGLGKLYETENIAIGYF